tara:strand:+ start:2911 stop:3696 length:786 start_codon:yes stop_codon:yes gene_type:complete
MGKKSTRNLEKKQRAFRDTQRENSKLAFTALGAGAAVLGAGVAKGALIEDENFPNFSNLLIYQPRDKDGNPEYSSQDVQMNIDYNTQTVDNLMIRDSYGNDSVVAKDESVWRMGFAKYVSGGIVFGGYANNNNNTSNDNPTIAGGWCQGLFYDSVFANGEDVDAVYLVHDQLGNGIGNVTAGNWTRGVDDILYTTDKIEFDGVVGDVSQMPVPTYMGETLILPHMVAVPEPATLATLGLMGALALGGRAKRFVRKLSGKKK